MTLVIKIYNILIINSVTNKLLLKTHTILMNTIETKLNSFAKLTLLFEQLFDS